MSRVKPLMIARHILAWLWLLVWLTASSGAQARVVSSAEFAPAFAATDGQGNQQSDDLAGVHFQALRASRRVDLQSNTPNPLVGCESIDAAFVRPNDFCGAPISSETSLQLASGWQFFLRTALSPRAPSIVS